MRRVGQKKKKKLHHVKKKDNSNLMFYDRSAQNEWNNSKSDDKDTDTNQFTSIK
jgi:hypothetical protein